MVSLYKNINEVHIEITNMCNLSCTYCYAETIFPSKHKPINLFTNDLYRSTITKLLSETKSDFLDIVFHGGEPLLHKAEWFDEACTFATQIASKLNKKVFFSMQSNLTILRDAHLIVFKKHKLSIGVSLDGDKKTHDAMRGKFNITINNIKKLRKADLFGGVIIVVSHHNYNKIPDFFKLIEELELNTFHLNIASSVGRGDPMEHLGTEKTFRAWKDCIDYMLKYEGQIIDTRLIKKINQFLNPPETTDDIFHQLRCDNIFCHAGVTMVAVQHDGNVFPCGCAGSSGNMKNFKLDNMIEPTKKDSIAYFKTLENFHTKNDKYYNECVSCPARFVCEHGCPAFDHTDPITPENTCRATKELYKYLTKIERKKLVELVANHESKTVAYER